MNKMSKDNFNISFADTYNDADIYDDNQRYTHYHTPTQLIKYYANYFHYKVMPDVETFIADYDQQKSFHALHGQQHALFIFPENKVLDENLMDKAKSLGFTVEKMELYVLKEMPQSKDTEIVVVQVVNDDDVLTDFLEICREGDLEYGVEFADLKEKTHRRDLLDEKILQFTGYLHGFPAGKVEAIESDSLIELDDFYVLDAMRKQGVGTALQQAVWHYAKKVGKQVILIADGHDSPREMYQRQGYTLVSERFELLSVPSENVNASVDNINA